MSERPAILDVEVACCRSCGRLRSLQHNAPGRDVWTSERALIRCEAGLWDGWHLDAAIACVRYRPRGTQTRKEQP